MCVTAPRLCEDPLLVITCPRVIWRKKHSERIRDWPKLGCAIHPDLKRRLDAIADVQGRPLWQVVSDAVRVYYSALPAEEKERTDRLARGVKPVEPDTRRIEVPKDAIGAVEAFLRCWFSPDGEVEEGARHVFGAILGIPV